MFEFVTRKKAKGIFNRIQGYKVFTEVKLENIIII